MAKPSNPATYFVSGNTWESFTYGGGNKLFYAKLREEFSGSCGYIHGSLLISANSVEHVKQIIKDIIEHRAKCAEKYRESKGQDTSSYLNSIEQIKKLRSLEDQWEIEEAPKDQVFKVSRSDSDIF